MLITNSTPRITYKIGIRKAFGTNDGGTMAELDSGASMDGVAAEFTGVYRILMSTGGSSEEKQQSRNYESTTRNARLERIWQINAF